MTSPGPPIEGLEYVEHLGTGGSSNVYLYERKTPRMRVAVKVLRDPRLSDFERMQFAAEAEAMAKLADHPSIVQVFSTGVLPDQRPYLVMKYYPPPNLGVRAARDRMSVADVLRTGIQIASAVETAHRAGILHRDIKPANILVSQYGEPGLTDFGIAGHMANATDTDTLGVSIPWAPREVLSGTSNGSVQSDIYSLAATLWTLLVGRSPFEVPGGDNSPRALLTRILRSTAPAPGRADAPPSLDRLLARAMAQNPKTRPRSALEFAQALQAVEQEQRFARTKIVVDQPEGTTSGSIRPVTRGGEDATRIRAPRRVDAQAPSELAPPESLHAPLKPIDKAPESVRAARPLQPSAAPEPLTSKRPAVSDDISSPDTSVSTNPPDSSTPRHRRRDESEQEAVLAKRYHLLERLGDTQSGTMYKAYDRHRGSLVAIKLLDAPDRDVQFRLERGGRVWLNLVHPNIVRVYDVANSSRAWPAFVVSEYVEGVSLDSYHNNHDVSLAEAINIVGQLGDALGYLHSQGIVHREVNQRNVMLSAQRPVKVTLLDSGIARSISPEVEEFTKIGVFVGDQAYAAPEQLAGSKVTHRVDIWALAALLYDLVCPSPRPIDPMGNWQPDVANIAHLPSGIRSAITRGLSHDPTRRYGSVHDFQTEIGFENRVDSDRRYTIVVALHGIRTQAAWQRAFSEVALSVGIAARLDRWNFGYFSLLRFLSPWSRAARVRWFREMYQAEFGNPDNQHPQPSIVAHSFGTYILGNALLRYPYLRFDKVLLCGSILPCDFPWDELIERGQVGALRNEYGIEDFWTRAVGMVVPGTGPSGLKGFETLGLHVTQEEFRFTHSEYFSRAHMRSRWIPFLVSPSSLTRPSSAVQVSYRPTSRPWALWLAYVAVILGVAWILVILTR